MLKKLMAGWNGDAVPWPDEVSPELVKAKGELAAAKDKFAELGPKLAEAHRRVMAIEDAPYVDLSAPDGAERMAERRQEYADAQRKLDGLVRERKELHGRIAELEPKVQQLAAGASRAIVEQVRPQHADLVRRLFIGVVGPVADSIVAQIELTNLLAELTRREVQYGSLPPPPTADLGTRYAMYREQAAELMAAGVLKASDLPPALATAWRMA